MAIIITAKNTSRYVGVFGLYIPRKSIAQARNDAGYDQEQRPKKDLDHHQYREPKHFKRPCEAAERTREPPLGLALYAFKKRSDHAKRHDSLEEIVDKRRNAARERHPHCLVA